MADITENDFVHVASPDGDKKLWAYGEDSVDVKGVSRFYANTLKHEYSVAEFGAVADAKYLNPGDNQWYQDAAFTTPATDNMQAFKDATAALGAQGGGRLIVPGFGQDTDYDSGTESTEYIRNRYFLGYDTQTVVEGLYTGKHTAWALTVPNVEIIGVGNPWICAADGGAAGDNHMRILAFGSNNGNYNAVNSDNTAAVDTRPWLEHIRVAGVTFDATAFTGRDDGSTVTARHVRDFEFDNCTFFNGTWNGGHGVIEIDVSCMRWQVKNTVFLDTLNEVARFALHADGGRDGLISNCIMNGVGGTSWQGNLDHGIECSNMVTEGCHIFNTHPDSGGFAVRGGPGHVIRNNSVRPSGSRNTFFMVIGPYNTGATQPPAEGNSPLVDCVVHGNTFEHRGGSLDFIDMPGSVQSGTIFTENKFINGPRGFQISGATGTVIAGNYVDCTRLLRDTDPDNGPIHVGFNWYGPGFSEISFEGHPNVQFMSTPGYST